MSTPDKDIIESVISKIEMQDKIGLVLDRFTTLCVEKVPINNLNHKKNISIY